MITKKVMSGIFDKAKSDKDFDEIKKASERLHTKETLKLLCGGRVQILEEHTKNRRIVYKVNKEDYLLATEWLCYLENALWDGIHVMLTSYPDEKRYYVSFDLTGLKY